MYMEFCDYNFVCETIKRIGKVSKKCAVFLSLIYFFASFHHGQETLLSPVSFPKAIFKFQKDFFKVVREYTCNNTLNTLLKNLGNVW